jgi:hypothetical protein
MAKSTLFDPQQFAPTPFHSATDKARFANELIAFIAAGFPRSKWTKRLYDRLNGCFGHIAHYNLDGFWAEWFDTPADQLRFLDHLLRWRCCGHPEFTFCDVEAAVAAWLRESGLPARIEREAAAHREAGELAQLCELAARYGVALPDHLVPRPAPLRVIQEALF